MLSIYSYDAVTKCYHMAGRSGLCNVLKTLHLNVTPYIQHEGDTLKLDTEHGDLAIQLEGYVPYHEECERLLNLDNVNSDHATISDSEEEEPYIVERILKKRYNSRKSQHEYFIKWKGYSSKENTWELPTNIPGDMLDGFKQEQVLQSSSSSRSSANTESNYGLRQRVRPPNKSGYIFNL